MNSAADNAWVRCRGSSRTGKKLPTVVNITYIPRYVESHRLDAGIFRVSVLAGGGGCFWWTRSARVHLNLAGFGMRGGAVSSVEERRREERKNEVIPYTQYSRTVLCT